MPKSSDADPSVPTANPRTSVALDAQRSAARMRTQATASLNWRPPEPQFDIFGKRFFDAAPTQLARSFLPPVAPSGTFSRGGRRIVSSGFGDTRAAGYKAPDGSVDRNRHHMGLDFSGALGEPVYASADGRVSFIGVQLRIGYSIPMSNVSVDGDGNVIGKSEANNPHLVDRYGHVLVPPLAIGHGGLFVEITHNGDFPNYKTQYMHLGGVPTELQIGQTIKEGTVIGQMGTTGGNGGKITSGIHVHWQVRFQGVLVRPEALVPHFKPGDDSTALAKSYIPNVADPNSSNGVDVVTREVVSGLMAHKRSTDAENQQIASIRQTQSEFYTGVANRSGAEAGKVFQAIAAFEQYPPIVDPFMAFDFGAGVWNDGDPDHPVGAGKGI